MITRIHDEAAPHGHRLTIWRHWNPISRQHCYAVELLRNGIVVATLYEGTERYVAFAELSARRAELSAPLCRN